MIIYESKWLVIEDEIVEYFEDIGADFLDCGQGYYEDEGEVFAKIGEQYYLVKIKATVYGEKQDRGDKLYFVDSIDKVTYKKVTEEEVNKVVNKDILASIEQLEKEIVKLKAKLR